MQTESYSAATHCLPGAFGHSFIASHLVISGRKALRDMNRNTFKNERMLQKAFAKPGTRAGVYTR